MNCQLTPLNRLCAEARNRPLYWYQCFSTGTTWSTPDCWVQRKSAIGCSRLRCVFAICFLILECCTIIHQVFALQLWDWHRGHRKWCECSFWFAQRHFYCEMKTGGHGQTGRSGIMHLPCCCSGTTNGVSRWDLSHLCHICHHQCRAMICRPSGKCLQRYVKLKTGMNYLWPQTKPLLLSLNFL